MLAHLLNRPGQTLFHVTGLGLVFCYGLLAWLSREHAPLAYGGFVGLWVIGFVGSLLAAWLVRAHSISFGPVLFWCVVLRTLLLTGDPIYEDDYYRYLWDGKQTIETGSPYREPPSAFFDTEQEPQWEAILGEINNPDLPTLYGPVNQYVFALAYVIDPGNVWVLQLIFALVDLLIILTLSRLAGLASVILYGFSPLILKEFTLTAHPDLLAVFPMLLAILFWKKANMYAAATALAFAVSAKLFAFLLVPLLLRWHWRAWLLFATTALALHLPLENVLGQVESLQAMAGTWLFNAPLYYLTYSYLDFDIVKLVSSALFLAIYAGYFFLSDYHQRHPPQVPRGDWLFMMFLVASPVFNAWYYAFVLVFAVIHPSVWAWVASLMLVLAYATGLQLHGLELEAYEHPIWVILIEFIAVLIAVVVPWSRLADAVLIRK